jgi:hypothetical protein
MTAYETSQLIVAAGGDSAFAKLLGIEDQQGAAQRVNNWKRRGMPSSVELDHYETIRALKKQSALQSAT